mmetsp:Transcript_402/g.877  ORF Transcript_402/g.877 Transcript_402/m.877 type:complete len:236 (+) Transcript_402:388-1095(+)
MCLDVLRGVHIQHRLVQLRGEEELELVLGELAVPVLVRGEELPVVLVLLGLAHGLLHVLQGLVHADLQLRLRQLPVLVLVPALQVSRRLRVRRRHPLGVRPQLVQARAHILVRVHVLLQHPEEVRLGHGHEAGPVLVLALLVGAQPVHDLPGNVLVEHALQVLPADPELGELLVGQGALLAVPVQGSLHVRVLFVECLVVHLHRGHQGDQKGRQPHGGVGTDEKTKSGGGLLLVC